MTFAMDTTGVSNQGVAIANDANTDLSNSTPLVYAVIVDQDSMPTMFTSALTTFYQNLGDALDQVFNQRYDMGQALQGIANDAELQDLRIATSFKGNSSQGGLLPMGPTN